MGPKNFNHSIFVYINCNGLELMEFCRDQNTKFGRIQIVVAFFEIFSQVILES